MVNVCDACNKSFGSGWYSWNGFPDEEQQNTMWKFIAAKSGKTKTGDNFELCGNCAEEFKKIFSNELKTKIISQLSSQKATDCQLLSKFFQSSYLLDNDFSKVRQALVENIQRYSQEWQIKEVNWNKDGKEYNFFWQSWQTGQHPSRISKLTVLIHQSASLEYSSNGFLIIYDKKPKQF